MNPIKKIWYDNNSEPPKNYIWVKDDKPYEFDVVSRNWKEVASTSSGTGSSGASLSGNLLDDWVNAVTQGEYTKYEDVPLGVAGPNNGWTKLPHGFYEVGAASTLSFLSLGGPEAYNIYENALYQKETS